MLVSATTVDVVANDTLAAGSTIVATTAGTAQGTITDNGDGTIDYTPAAGDAGLNSRPSSYESLSPRRRFRVTSLCDTATVTIDVPNDAVDDTAVAPLGAATTVDVLANDTLAAGSTIVATTAGTAAGTITNNGTDIDYTPAAGEAGTTVDFSYEVCPPGAISGDPLCDTATVTIDVPQRRRR